MPVQPLNTLLQNALFQAIMGERSGSVARYGPEHLAGQWEWDPLVLILLLVSLALYLAGSARADLPDHLRRRRLTWFVVGWSVAAVALVSPLHGVGLQLFSAHMAQHVLLMLVAAPLIMLGRPVSTMMRSLPEGAMQSVSAVRRLRTIRSLTRYAALPAVAWLIHLVAVWTWHIPALFEGAVYDELLHALEHASFFGTALIFWAVLIRLSRRRSGVGIGILYVFTTGMHNALLGVLLTFSREPWYDVYGLTAPMWGVTPLEDQQIGGLIMWVPASVTYLISVGALLYSLLQPTEVRSISLPRPTPAGAPADVDSGRSTTS